MNGASPVFHFHLLDIVAARRNPSLILSKPAFTFRARTRSVCQHAAVAKRKLMISMTGRREFRLTAATAQGEMKTMDLPSGMGLSSPSQRESIHGSIFKVLAVALGRIRST